MSQIDSQLRLSKNKIKKYEVYLKKSLEALRKIGRELSFTCSKANNNAINKKNSQSKSQNKSNDNPMMISEFERDFYKDSVNILGVSLDELEEFMNPALINVNAEN